MFAVARGSEGSVTGEAHCPPGMRVVGGAVMAPTWTGLSPNIVTVTASHPLPGADGWFGAAISVKPGSPYYRAGQPSYLGISADCVKARR